MDTQANPQQPHFVEVDNKSDIALSKPGGSRFLFLLGFFAFFIFCWAGCYNLYTHKFQKNDDVKVPDNTLYEPKYK
jgi:hypothetical protein